MHALPELDEELLVLGVGLGGDRVDEVGSGAVGGMWEGVHSWLEIKKKNEILLIFVFLSNHKEKKLILSKKIFKISPQAKSTFYALILQLAHRFPVPIQGQDLLIRYLNQS